MSMHLAILKYRLQYIHFKHPLENNVKHFKEERPSQVAVLNDRVFSIKISKNTESR